MNENEKMYQIGVWTAGCVAVLMVMLQVCFRTQDNARKQIRSEIIRTQQEYAERQIRFASLVRPESLRSVVDSVLPKTEAIGFHKSVTIDDLPNRERKE